MVSMVKDLSAVCFDCFLLVGDILKTVFKNETARVRSDLFFSLFLLLIFASIKYIACHGL